MGLQGEDIPYQARIIAIADTYDAMTSDRAYRKALPLDVVMEEFSENRGIQFDPKMVDVFLEMIKEGFSLTEMGE